jgi:hypothetical protein
VLAAATAHDEDELTRALVEGPTRSPNNVQELNNASAILTTAVAYIYTCQVLHDEYN